MRHFFLSLLCSFALAVTSPAHAHSLWINVFETHVHQPPHALVSLGWGHNLPLDDILNAVQGHINVARFELLDPNGQKISLRLPPTIPAAASAETKNLEIYDADLAVHKLQMRPDCSPGAYQFCAQSVPTFVTQYIDTKGKKRMQLKPLDTIGDNAKTLMSLNFQAFAKSCMTIGPWKEAMPLGHALEIVPRTDLSTVRAGDLVEVDVLCMDKPLCSSGNNIEYITAQSNGFGQGEGFSLFSHIINGKAQFRIQNAGQWMISVKHKESVSADGPFKDLVGKADQVFQVATFTFSVK